MDHLTRTAVGMRLLALVAAVAAGTALAIGGVPPGAASRASVGSFPAPAARADAAGSWVWPVGGPRVVERAFEAPEHAYGAGHRGIDASAPPGAPVSSPALGTVLFAGPVGGRSVVTIDHGGGVVSSFDPVVPAVTSGESVGMGATIGAVQSGEALHCAAGCLHVGVRVDGGYVDPIPFFSRPERSVLLPLTG